MTPKSSLGEFEQMVLLAILQQGESAFAMEVRKEIEGSADRSVSRGAFYTTLDRLERKGMVRWTEERPDVPHRGAVLRRFQVTSKGLIALRDARQAMATLSRGLEELLERTP